MSDDTLGKWEMVRTATRIEVRTSPQSCYAFPLADAANARLIAAAPELLDALEAATNCLLAIQRDLTMPDVATSFKVARAAITKAKGGAK